MAGVASVEWSVVPPGVESGPVEGDHTLEGFEVASSSGSTANDRSTAVQQARSCGYCPTM